MNSLLLVVTNKNGKRNEFRLYEHEKQYSIGRDADISLETFELDLYDLKPKRRMYPVSGYITFIEGGWYFRAAKGVRRGRKAVKINGKLINSSNPEVLLKYGYTISFGEDDGIVATVYGNSNEETLKDKSPALSGLFDKVKLEFELLNKLIREVFGLDYKANTGLIMAKLEEHGLFNAAYEYNLARGLRNIIAHPSPKIESLKQDYVYEALRAIDSVKDTIKSQFS